MTAGPGTDPFKPHRDDGHLVIEVAGEAIPMVLGHADLRETARRWGTFSSDAPFRVPIPAEADVRSVRQLPIETDPPAHTAYRKLVRQPFSRLHAATLQPAVRTIVEDLLAGAIDRGRVEVIRELALPLQSRSLALMLGMPADHAERWIGWGTHVFRDLDAEEGHASELDGYIAEQIARARAEGGDDFFGTLAAATLDGRPLTDAEIEGFANLTFAGGRDTVINAVTNTVWWLARHPTERHALRDNPALVKTSAEEFLRYFSPLTHIGRVASTNVEVNGCPVSAGDRVSVGFAAANHDPAVFDAPGECRLDRFPNRHVAFGHGPHKCLGAPLARLVLSEVVTAVADRVEGLTVLDAEPNVEDLGPVSRQVGFTSLDVAVRGWGR